MTTIYLVRHGTTENNRSGIFQGSRDIELGQQGLEQAMCLSQRFSDVKIDAIYSSPLKRALATAQAINRTHELDIHIMPGLTELNGGSLEGNSGEQNLVLFPEQMRLLNERPYLFIAPGGESGAAVYSRMVNTMRDIAAHNPNSVVVVVSHGFAIQLYLGYALREKPELIKRYIVDNASVCTVEYNESLDISVTSMNDVAHIPESIRFGVAKNFM